MKIIELVKNTAKPVLSFEITPPEKGRGVQEIFQTLDALMPFDPQFVSVTYHQPHVVYEERGGVIQRIPKRKKPGTVGICASIKHRYNVEPVPHFICGGFDRYETEDALIDLQYLGIENILVLRGDPPPGQKTFIAEKDGHEHASSLVGQIAAMNLGNYLEPLDGAEPSRFCIGAAAYPEKHFEAPNAEKDLEWLKHKVDQGVDFLITQMFFEPHYFIDFVSRSREAGISVPIFPGIKPISSRRQLYDLPGTFHVNVPNAFLQAMDNARSPKEEFDLGAKWMADLVGELLDAGVPGIHVFTMGKGAATKSLLKRVF